MSNLLLAALLLAEAASPRVEPAEVPARGTHVATLAAPRFGRYAVSVKSEQGAALHLVDRMAGPGAAAGVAGERDGRLDLFLERGEHRVVVDGAERVSGNAAIRADAFRELHAEPPVLVELKSVHASLQDLEQRSYWLRVERAATVALEAAGRSLADLRLWRDGTWLVDAAPERERVQPKLGRPLNVCRLAARLEPGLYLLSAYGGSALPWAEDDGSQPFHLRMGLPRLPEAGRRRFTVSAFGSDRYRAPGTTTFVRAELSEARPLTLQAGRFDPDQPFASPALSASIAKDTLPPVAQRSLPLQHDGEQVVVVSGEHGQSYVLQQFRLIRKWNPVPAGSLWIGTVHSGAPEDSIDATGLLARERVDRRLEVTAEEPLTLDADGGWSRRANLLGTLSAVLRVTEAARYEVLLTGVSARARLEPLLLTRAAGYQEPPSQESGSAWDLDPGAYLLTVVPLEKGIVTITLRKKTLAGTVLAAVGLDTPPAERPVRAALRFPRTTGNQWLFVAEQPGVEVGLVARALPLDLTEPLFVAARPGETVTVPFANAEAGTLVAEAEDGSRLELSVDAGPAVQRPAVAAGTHELTVRHDRERTTLFTLALTPDRLHEDAPLPPLSALDRASLPDFPVLEPGRPQYLDLGRQRQATFRVATAEAGLYEMTTTGLLATRGQMRTRTRPQLAAGEQNGVGRNLSLRQYLREGDYQLSVETIGPSQGHLGVRVDRTPLVQGGFLTSRVPARRTLAAGEAIAYRFNVTRPGTFRIRSLGLGRSFRCRLEDLAGWPLLVPGSAADVTLALGPGKYRLIVLPETTEARVLTVIEPVTRAVARAGHGPHRLRLGQLHRHLWTEPEGDTPRLPDQWDLDLPTTVDLRLAVDGDMQGELLRRGEAADTRIATLLPGRVFKSSLERGAYRLNVRSVRRDNRAPYTVQASAAQMLAGQSRVVDVPSELILAIGEPGLYEVATFGETDVSARLFDEAGVQVAAADDAPDDWNPHLALPLVPGRYRLRIDPVGSDPRPTQVRLRQPQEQPQAALALPAALDASPGASSWVWPLEVPAAAEVVAASARSTDSVGLALEAQLDGAWQPVVSSAGRRVRAETATDPRATAWRLRAWSLDHRDSAIRLQVAALTPAAIDESAAAAGIPLASGTARLVLDRPGVLRVGPGVRVCAQPLVPCLETASPVAVPARHAWLLADPGTRASAARVVLAAGPGLTVATPKGLPLTLDVAPGGTRVVAVTSRTGQPGAAFLPSGAEPGDPSAFSPGPLAAIAAAVGPASQVSAWPASRAASQELRLSLHSYAPSASPAPLHNGVAEGTVPASGARAIELGDGRKRVQLGLDDGVVAVLVDGMRVRSVHGGFGTTTETVETEATRVTLLPTRGAGRFAVVSVPIAQPTVVAAGAAFEADFAAAGVIRLDVSGSAGGRLHVRGARGETTFVARDGRVARGADLDVSTPGTLLVSHPPGLLLAWLDTALHGGPWPPGPGAESQMVHLPASLLLSGDSAAVAVELAEPSLLHLRAPVRSVTLVHSAGGEAQVFVGREGTQRDVFAPAGRTELTLRALGGGALSGTLDVTATPVTELGEGLGPEALLPPGGSRLFAFTVERDGPVGIGVKASAGSVESVLLDAAGRALGHGAAQMPTLKAGRYLLALTAAADGPTVRAQAALAGLVPPHTGPPDEVVQSYLRPEDPVRHPREFAATRARQAWRGFEPAVDEGGEDEGLLDDEDPGEGEPEDEKPDGDDSTPEEASR